MQKQDCVSVSALKILNEKYKFSEFEIMYDTIDSITCKHTWEDHYIICKLAHFVHHKVFFLLTKLKISKSRKMVE